MRQQAADGGGVEEVGGGRIFVYETKSRRKTKSKRFAFNADGKRVDEKTLRRQKKKSQKSPVLEPIPKK